MANATSWFVHFAVLEFHSNSAVIEELDYICPNEDNYCIVLGTIFRDGLTHIYRFPLFSAEGLSVLE